jgi:hypothetical protein
MQKKESKVKLQLKYFIRALHAIVELEALGKLQFICPLIDDILLYMYNGNQFQILTSFVTGGHGSSENVYTCRNLFVC